MAKLPTAEALGLVQQGTSGGPMSSVQSDAISNAGAELGRAGQRFGETLYAIDARNQEQDARVSTATATAAVLAGRDRLNNELDQTPEDYYNRPKKFQEGFAKIVETAAATIKNPNARALWAANNQSFVARSQQENHQKAKTQEGNAYMAFNMPLVSDFLNKAADRNTSKEDSDMYLETAGNILTDMQSRGYKTPQDIAQIRENMAKGLVDKQLAQMSPSEKQEYLFGKSPGTFRETLRSGQYGVVGTDGTVDPENFRAMKPEVQEKARGLANAFGSDLTITPIGGAQPDKRSQASQHNHGTAIDIDIRQMPEAERTRLIATAVAQGANGFGAYSVGQGVGTIHVDWRAGKGNGPEGLSVWHRQGFGKDAGVETAPAWFQEGIRQGLEMKRNGARPSSGPEQLGEPALRTADPNNVRAGMTPQGRANLIAGEGPNNEVNSKGYAGYLQMGAPRLQDLGVYSAGPTENMASWSKTGVDAPGKWSGEFKIPGFPEVKTLDDFLANKKAQEKVGDLHMERLTRFIEKEGLGKYVGRNAGGVNITMDGIYAMAHLGGEDGARKFLTTNGQYDPGDGATKLSGYARKFSNSRNVGASPRLAVLGPDELYARQMKAVEERRVEVIGQNVERQGAITQLLVDDIAAIRSTGGGLPDTALNRNMVADQFGAQKATEWEAERARAQRYFSATSGMEGMEDADILRKVRDAKPKEGTPGFQRDMQDYEEIVKHAEKIVTRRNGEFEKQRKAQVDQWQDQASKGQISLPQIDDLFKNGALKTFEEKAGLIKLRKEYDTQEKNAATYKSMMESTVPVNPNDPAVKAALKANDSVPGGLAEGILKTDPAAAQLAIAQFIKVGAVSDIQKGAFEGIVRTGNPKQLNFAMQTLQQMYSNNANGFTEAFDKDTVKAVIAWTGFADRDPESFHKQLKIVLDPNRIEENKGREEEASAILNKMTDAHYLDKFSSWAAAIPIAGRAFRASEPATSENSYSMPSVKAEYATAFKEYFSKWRDEKGASAYADLQIKKFWAVSEAGGGRLMKYPPELSGFVPMLDGSHEWAAKQAKEDLATRYKPPKVTDPITGETYDASVTYSLVATPQTKSEIDIIKARGQLPDGRTTPSWTMVYQDYDTGQWKSAGLFTFDPKKAHEKNMKESQGKNAQPNREEALITLQREITAARKRRETP